jgi:hypothetical protein
MSKKLIVHVCTVLAFFAFAFTTAAQEQPTIYIQPTDDGFETYLAAAMAKKKVPVTVLENAEGATYILKAAKVEEEQVTTGKRLVNCLFAYCAGNENKASTSVTLVQDGEIKWSYAVNKGRGAKNRQSMAEAIAKHLKDEHFGGR